MGAQDKNNNLSSGQPIKIGVGYSQSTTSGIKSEWVCSYSLSQLYKANDVRTNAYIVKAKYGGVDYNAVAKYLGRDNGDPKGMLDIKYLRVAEILLNQAEAAAILGNDPNALTALDALRSQRYSNFSSGAETGQNLKDAIALERRLELAFEGDRWFDLKRKGLSVERDSFGDHADGTGQKYFVTELPADDYHWQYPIPQSVIQANTNLVQNPGF